jgi:sulfide dehydrogenase cytochrome subunit
MDSCSLTGLPLTSSFRTSLVACAAWLWLLMPIVSFGETGRIRVLAASCAACHGTEGNSVGGTPVLAGLDRLHFILQMQAFRSGERDSTVMHHHARGLDQMEIEQLANYFASQQRTAVVALKPLGR